MATNRRIKHAENPEHFRRLVAESTKRNYNKKLQSNNLYRKNNPDKVSLWKKKDRIENKVRILADNAMRRTKLKTPITSEIKQIYALRDFYKAMSLGDEFHVDHVIPVAKGGLHTIENLMIIPAICNLRKGAKNAG
jgi:5-methylcytosine-specific restriction endonuclease McrA